MGEAGTDVTKTFTVSASFKWGSTDEEKTNFPKNDYQLLFLNVENEYYPQKYDENDILKSRIKINTHVENKEYRYKLQQNELHSEQEWVGAGLQSQLFKKWFNIESKPYKTRPSPNSQLYRFRFELHQDR